MRVRVLYFATARELASVRNEDVSVPEGSAVGVLVRQLLALHPGLKSLGNSVRYSLNHEVVGNDAMLNDGDEVGVLPPVAGG